MTLAFLPYCSGSPNSQFHVHPCLQELPCWDHQECLDQHGQNCLPISSWFSFHWVHMDQHRGGAFILIFIKTLWNFEYLKFSSYQYSSTHWDHALSKLLLGNTWEDRAAGAAAESHTQMWKTDSNHVQTFSCTIKNDVSKNLHQLCKPSLSVTRWSLSSLQW